MASIASGLIASLVDSPQGLADYIRLGLDSQMFRGPEEQAQWAILTKTVLMYGGLPSRAQFETAGHALPISHPDPLDWYADQLRTRHSHLMLKQAVQDVSECLNGDNVALAQETFVATALNLTKSKHKNRIVNFAAAGKEIIAAEIKAKKLQGDNHGIKFGWPTLDAMADGLVGGDLISIVGRPGQGKTYAMLFTASHAWMKQGRTVMFVTMEMKPLPIIQRLAALNATKSITQLKKAELSTKAESDLMMKLESYKLHKDFWVVDGALAATASDIVMMARQLKPDVIWVDGGYLVKSENRMAKRWERVTEVCEVIKGDLLEALNIPGVLSFQFNREQKKTEVGSIDNIAGADAVGQISSVVLGMGLTDDEGSPENVYKRKVDILKGRNGEVGSFDINWKFDIGPNFMDFSEIKNLDEGDLAYGVG